jgi:hypothetical protein
MHDRTAKTLECVGRLFVAASTLHPQKEHGNMATTIPRTTPAKFFSVMKSVTLLRGSGGGMYTRKAHETRETEAGLRRRREGTS